MQSTAVVLVMVTHAGGGLVFVMNYCYH
ncbi:unnamed protein product [Ectocarpus sp. CCAP 1310/34]|nr:unnamed protein product [Ectocarpus sp. CCAP 1310/34]